MASGKDIHLQGALQLALMRTLWESGEAGVEQVRDRLPRRFRDSAYTTVQTVLNRLAERGLIRRRREGRAILYAARIDESDYYSRSLRNALAPASQQARRAALVQLVGDLSPAEITEIESLAREAARLRKRR